MTTGVWVNDYPLDAAGWLLETVAGWQDGLTQKAPTIAIPGRAGLLATGQAAADSRVITLGGHVGPFASHALCLQAVDLVKAIAGSGLAEVRLVDRVDRTFWAQLTNVRVSGGRVWGLDFYRKVELTFTCLVPVGFDQLGRTAAFSATPANIWPGSAPLAPIVRIYAPTNTVTNPTLTYRDLAGNIRGQLGLTQVLTVNDWIEANLDTQVISRVLSGVVSGPVPIASGDFFALDPADGDSINNLGPTLEVTASSGTPTGLALFRRMWQ